MILDILSKIHSLKHQGTYRESLPYVSFISANFISANFNSANFISANFISANFISANFISSNFISANLISAIFQDSAKVSAEILSIYFWPALSLC